MHRHRSRYRIITWLLVVNMATVAPMAFGQGCCSLKPDEDRDEPEHQCPCCAKHAAQETSCCDVVGPSCCQKAKAAPKKCACCHHKLPQPTVPAIPPSQRQLPTERLAASNSQPVVAVGEKSCGMIRRAAIVPQPSAFYGRMAQTILCSWLI